MFFRFVATIGIVFGWVAFFLLGAYIDSNVYRAELQVHFTVSTFLTVLIAWTPTNVAVLSLFAGLFGGLIREQLIRISQEDASRPAGLIGRELAGVFSGVVVYILVLAYLLFTRRDPFAVTTEAMYFQMAGLISFSAFFAGFWSDIIWKRLRRNGLVNAVRKHPVL